MIKISKTNKEYCENDTPYSSFTPEIFVGTSEMEKMAYQQINHNLSSPLIYWIETSEGMIK